MRRYARNRRRKRELGWGPVPAHLGAWRARWVRGVARSLLEIEADPAREENVDAEVRALAKAGRRREALMRALARYEGAA